MKRDGRDRPAPGETVSEAAVEQDPEVDEADLTAAELARIARRDRDAAASERELMNSGSAKWFKQALDHQARIARSDGPARKPGPRQRKGR